MTDTAKFHLHHEKICTWGLKEVEDEHCIYTEVETSCGKIFEYDGSEQLKGYQFCPYCGNKMTYA